MKKTSSFSNSAFFRVRSYSRSSFVWVAACFGFAALGAPANPVRASSISGIPTSPPVAPVVANAKPQESRLVRTARALTAISETLPRVKPVERERPELEDPTAEFRECTSRPEA